MCSALHYKLIYTVVTERCGTRLLSAETRLVLLNWAGARLKLGVAQYPPISHILILDETWACV